MAGRALSLSEKELTARSRIAWGSGIECRQIQRPDPVRHRREFLLRKREGGHASARSILYQLRDLAFVAGSKGTIVGERRGAVSVSPILTVESGADLVELFFY
jgi:hypothetical protein